MTKYRIYKHLIDGVYVQYNLRKPISKEVYQIFNTIQIIILFTSTETGRYRGVPFSNRFCFSCKDDIEDGFHFILKCPLYETLRKTYIKPFFTEIGHLFLNLLCYSHMKISKIRVN